MDLFALTSSVLAALSKGPRTEAELLEITGQDGHDLLITMALSGQIKCHPRLDQWELASDDRPVWAPLAGRLHIPEVS